MISNFRPVVLHVALALSAATFGASAIAQGAGAKDADFLKQAAQNGAAEVEAGRVAQRQAQNRDVKTFATQMVDDHTKANQELTALARRKGIDVPAEASLLQKGQLKLLGTKNGADFDRGYIEQMGIKAHRETVELFANGMRDAQDPEVKSFATKTLPKLKDHLAMAERLQDRIGAKPQ